MELQTVKDYLRIDYDDDDILIDGMKLAAKQYLTNAGVPEQSDNKLYNVVLIMLISFFYDNRSIDSKSAAIPGTINNLITQLSCSV